MIKLMLLNVVKRLMKKTGYRIVRRSAFDDTLDKLLTENDNFYFIQVGANDGVRFDTLYYKLTQYNISGIVIEPLERYFNRLKLNYQDYPNVVPLNIAIHPNEEEIDIFYVDPHKLPQAEPWKGGIGSTYKSHLHKNNTPDKWVRKVSVKCKSFQNLLDEFSPKKIDLLQIDAEGLDYEILLNFPLENIKPKIIKFEYINLSMTERSKSIEHLHKNHYKTYLEEGDIIGILT